MSKTQQVSQKKIFIDLAMTNIIKCQNSPWNKTSFGENKIVKILSKFRHAKGCEFPMHPATAGRSRSNLTCWVHYLSISTTER